MGASIGKGSKDGPSHHVAGAGVAVYSIWASPREPNRIRWGDTTSERENREGESGNKVCVGCCCLHLNVQRQWRPAGRERESQSCNRPPELLLLCCPWDQQIATKHNSAAAEKFSANRNIWSPAQLTQRSLYLWHLASCVLAARSFDWASYSSCLHIRSRCSICLPPAPFSLLPFFFWRLGFFRRSNTWPKIEWCKQRRESWPRSTGAKSKPARRTIGETSSCTSRHCRRPTWEDATSSGYNTTYS